MSKTSMTRAQGPLVVITSDVRTMSIVALLLERARIKRRTGTIRFFIGLALGLALGAVL